MFGSLQEVVVFVLSLAVAVGAVWAFIDAMRHAPATFIAAGKQNKLVWGVILGLVMAITFVLLPSPLGAGPGILGIFGVICIIVVAYYFVDVAKKLREHQGGPRAGGW